MQARLGQAAAEIRAEGRMHRLEVTWVSNAAGDVELWFDSYDRLAGVPYRLETEPRTTPSASYDIKLLDLAGVDLLLGKGVDRSASAAESVFIYDATNTLMRAIVPADYPLRLTVAAAGDSKSGVIRLWLLPLELIGVQV